MEDNFKAKAAEWDSPMKIAMTQKFVSELLNNIKIDKSLKVMELGCGTGLVGLQIADQVKAMVMLDNSKAMLDKLREKISEQKITEQKPTDHKVTDSRITIVNGTVEKYTTKDIDVVFSLMAFHHIENISSTLGHISSILKPDGYLVIGDLKEEDGSFHGEEKVPHNGFNIDALAKQMENNDLDILTAYTYNTISRGDKNFEQFIIVAKKSGKN